MFKFSLQTVLEVRERFERIKYKEYGAELFILQNLEDEHKQLAEGLNRSAQDMNSLKATSPVAVPFQWFGAYKQRIREKMERLEARMREQGEVVELKRKELVEARRSHKALEILRDKEKSRYDTQQNRLERTVMDEIAANYHIFNR
ncbi:MAG: flagellar export protein FliJ [Deltaproteobacteria bacterium]|nr:flagellar export protein FliJ [Deltaproteobacteria bacterium]